MPLCGFGGGRGGGEKVEISEVETRGIGREEVAEVFVVLTGEVKEVFVVVTKGWEGGGRMCSSAWCRMGVKEPCNLVPSNSPPPNTTGD